MAQRRTSLSSTALRFLKTAVEYRGYTNYAGTSQKLRERLTALGLVTHRPHSTYVESQKHTQWSSYKLTDAGFNVLCAEAFDSGLKAGFQLYCEQLDGEAARLREEQEQEVMRSFGTTLQSYAAVRRALFQHVSKEES